LKYQLHGIAPGCGAVEQSPPLLCVVCGSHKDLIELSRDEERRVYSLHMPRPTPQIIGQCRENHESSRRASATPAFERPLGTPELPVFKTGLTVWAAMVKANRALYQPGEIDLPGCAIFSFDPHFDANPQELMDISRAVRELREKADLDPSLKAFAALVADDHSNFDRRVVPRSLTGDRDVYYTIVRIIRHRLPTGYIADRLVPVIADQKILSPVVLLPLELWSGDLIQDWKSIAGAQPPPVAPALPPLSFADYCKNPLVVSPGAAGEFQAIMAKQKLKNASLRVTEESGAFGMDLTTNPANSANEFGYPSQGIRLIVPHRCARNLMGIEINFVQSGQSRGFTFKRRT
jgi:Fe-S cluster assembly iron-binding protein IscA